MNTEKFTGKAAMYKRYRPEYPEQFIEYLYSEAGLERECIISDIGSGTGILSRQLLEKGSRVICVEPNMNMRHIAETELSSFQNFSSVDGTAENTALPEKSVDFVTVAQAFHWFEVEKFKKECQRILRTDGKVVLVWNSRVANSGLVIENGELCKRYCPDFKGFSGGQEEKPEAFSSFFKAGVCEYRVFKNDLSFTKESFIGRNLSASYAPKEKDLNYLEFVEELSALFDKYGENGILIFPNVTRSYVGRV